MQAVDGCICTYSDREEERFCDVYAFELNDPS